MNAGSEGVTDLADGFIRFKLQLAFALWVFQLILKMKAGFALSGVASRATSARSPWLRASAAVC